MSDPRNRNRQSSVYISEDERREIARRKRLKAKRERIRRKKRNIRLAVYACLALIIILIIVIAVSCSSKKKSQVAANDSGDIVIPESYVEATFTRDEIESYDEIPAVAIGEAEYKLCVNTAQNVVTVYKVSDGSAIRAFRCSTGAPGSETPDGTYILGEWYTDWVYAVDGTWLQYAYRIIDNINNDLMFHSVPYTAQDKSTLETDQYNLLGTSVSAGCIRLPVYATIFIGENCSYGTEVNIYSDASEVIPVEIEEPYTIPVEIDELAGWDPTDPVTSNPWHKYEFTFEVPNSINVKTESTEAVLEAVFNSNIDAIDVYGNDLSALATYEGTFDLNTPGKYLITVKLDIGPIHASKEVVMIVSATADTSGIDA